MFPDLLSRYRAVIIAALMLVLPVGTIALERRGYGRGLLDQTAMMGIGALLDTGAFAFGFVEGFWEDYVALRDMKEENEALRDENARLREERARLLGVLHENARLRELLGFQKERDDLSLRPARVIARDVTPYFRVLRLKLDLRDFDQPVQEGMAVVSDQGVVGRISKVFDGYADVTLVADPTSRIDVVAQRNRARGIVIGLGHKRDYESKLAYLLRKDEIRAGDVLVTSGKGGTFPQELIVGTVASITRRDFGLEQQAIIEPEVDVGRLEEVFIVTAQDKPDAAPAGSAPLLFPPVPGSPPPADAP